MENEKSFLNQPFEKSKKQEEDPFAAIKLLDKTIQYGSKDDLKKLFEDGMDINQGDWEDRTALMFSVAKGNKDMVEWLLDQGADINKVFMYHKRIPKTALDAAIETNKKELVEFLIKKGAKRGLDITDRVD